MNTSQRSKVRVAYWKVACSLPLPLVFSYVPAAHPGTYVGGGVNAIAGITYCYAGNTSTYDTDWPTLLKEVLLFDCVFQSNNGTYWGIPDDKPVGTHEIVAASTAAYGEGVCEGQAYGLSGAYFDVNIPPYYDSTGGWGMCSS